MGMEVAAQVAGFHQSGEFALPGGVQFPHPAAQFGGDPRQTEAGVEGGFIGEGFDAAGLGVGDAVFVQRQPHPVGEIAQLDVVLLAAGEVLQHGADGGGFASAEVDLDPGAGVGGGVGKLNDDAGFAGAAGEGFAGFGEGNQGAGQFLGLGGDGDQIDVADGFLPAAQTAGGDEQRGVGATVAQGGDDRFGGGQGVADGGASGHRAGGAEVAQDTVGGPLAHTGEGGQASIGGGLLYALDGGDAQIGGD